MGKVVESFNSNTLLVEVLSGLAVLKNSLAVSYEVNIYLAYKPTNFPKYLL